MKKRGIMIITFYYLIILQFFSACRTFESSSSISSNEIDNEEISVERSDVQNKKLNLVTLPYPPYSYENEGKLEGIAIDIVTEVFKRMGYEIEIRIFPWTRSLEMVRSGSVDAMFTAYKTPEREAFADYSNEILINQTVSLFVKASSNLTFDGRLEDLKEYKIGVVRSVSYGNKFDEMVKNKVLEVEEADNGEQNMEKLLGGRFDILISNKYGALHILKKMNQMDKVREVYPEVEVVPSYIAFSKLRNLTDIRDRFDEILAEMVRDGEIDAFIEKYTK